MLNIGTLLQSHFRRNLQSIGATDGTNNTTSFNGMVYNYFRTRLGTKFKYVVFTSILFSFFLFESMIHSYEMKLWNDAIHATNHTVHYSPVIQQRNISSIPAAQNATSQISYKKISADSRTWFSLLISFFTWMIIIQIIQYIRNRTHVVFSSGMTRPPSQIQLLRQLLRFQENIDNTLPGLSNRLRLALLQRDFTGDDYELLQQLDEDNDEFQGATQTEIDRLPLHTIREEDIPSHATLDQMEEGTEHTHDLGSCNICLAPYEVGDEIRTVVCLHKFHRHCIDPWLQTKAVCPICKSPAVYDR
jgi:hypothetical protein